MAIFHGSADAASTGGGGNLAEAGPYASAPGTPASDGDTWVSDDGIVTKIGEGGAWLDSVPGWVPAIPPIPTTGWTAEGTSHLWSTNKGIRTARAAPGSGQGGFYRAAPFTHWRATGWFAWHCTEFDSSSLLFGMQDGTGKSLAFHMTANDGGGNGHAYVLYLVYRPSGWLNGAGQTLPVQLDPHSFTGSRFAMRVTYDGTGAVGSENQYEISADGVVWHTLGFFSSSTYGTMDRLISGCGGAVTGATLASLQGLKLEDVS
jgi:hypothetical protein